MRKVLFKTKIDFEALEAWRDEERDNIPPIGFLSVYKALGIVTEIDKYCKEHEARALPTRLWSLGRSWSTQSSIFVPASGM